MTILLVAATPPEIALTTEWMLRGAVRQEENRLYFRDGGVAVEVLITGVGLVNTALLLGERLAGNHPKLAIQAGIGGAVNPSLRLGEVVQITSDVICDLGAETAEGGFIKLNDMGIPGAGQTDRLTLPTDSGLPMRRCAGGSVNCVHGSADSIAALRDHYPEVEVESMEGYAFFQACLRVGVEPLQLRSVSNYVEPRNRENWEVEKAVRNLDAALRSVLGPFIS